MTAPILKYFISNDHVTNVAELIDDKLPDGAEKSAGLRKLLEAQDCFERAKEDV